MTRLRLLAYVLYAYAVAGVLVGVPLIFSLGPAATVVNQTSGRVLGTALLALSFGALATARDPMRNKALLVVEMLFTGMAALALVWRLAVDENVGDRAWWLLPPMLVCLALLLLLFPYGNRARRGVDDDR
jgi:hypothetical protein